MQLSLPSQKEQTRDLVVSDIATGDDFVIALSHRTRRMFDLQDGEIVMVASKRKSTVLVALGVDDLDVRFAGLNSDARDNLGLAIGETITLRLCRKIDFVERMTIRPINFRDKTGLSSAFETHLLPYFRDAYRPQKQGDIFSTGPTLDTITFEVAKLTPSSYGVVTKNTIIYYNVNQSRKHSFLGRAAVTGLARAMQQ